MATHKLVYQSCDACRKNNWQEQAEIVTSEDFRFGTLDICADCADADWFICRRCKKVHQFECPEYAAYEATQAAKRAEGLRNPALPLEGKR